MNDRKNISVFKKRWLTLREAAAALETDDEGLLQAFESGAVARDLPVYVLSDRENFSGMCLPIKFAHQLANDQELRASVEDELGHIANDPRRERAEDWERWFQLIGAFRIRPSTLKRIARERALVHCPVAPSSWWFDNGPVPKNSKGDPDAYFAVTLYDRVRGERPISFENIRFKADDIQQYVEGGKTLLVDVSQGASLFADKWPWGTYETEALRHLEAAAKRFWVNYDPDDPSSAEGRDTIVEWLKAERGITSSNLANSIASILRADGLRTGPRK